MSESGIFSPLGSATDACLNVSAMAARRIPGIVAWAGSH